VVEGVEVVVLAWTLDVGVPVVEVGELGGFELPFRGVLFDGWLPATRALVEVEDVWYWSNSTSPASANAVSASSNRTRFSLEDRIFIT
jgi:hypothetical protein